MDSSAFDILLSLVDPKIRKMDTVIRSSISCSEWLFATLRFLATGNLYEDLKFGTCIFTSSLSYIIPETCKALYEVLAPQYLTVSILFYFSHALLITSIISLP